MQEGDKGGVWDIVEKGAEYADFVTSLTCLYR